MSSLLVWSPPSFLQLLTLHFQLLWQNRTVSRDQSWYYVRSWFLKKSTHLKPAKLTVSKVYQKTPVIIKSKRQKWSYFQLRVVGHSVNRVGTSAIRAPATDCNSCSCPASNPCRCWEASTCQIGCQLRSLELIFFKVTSVLLFFQFFTWKELQIANLTVASMPIGWVKIPASGLSVDQRESTSTF